MPLLRRQPFVKCKPPSDLKPDDEVFFCEVTKEIFTDYEKFFERVILCNSLVWTCELTGKSGLTYQEALDSEQAAKKQLSSFPSYLQKPILLLASKTHRSRLIDVNDDIFGFVKERYFVGEAVEVSHKSGRKSCKVIKVIGPHDQGQANGKGTPTADNSDADSDVVCLDPPSIPTQSPSKSVVQEDPEEPKDPSEYEYVVQEASKTNIFVIKADHITRKKGLFTRDRCKLYLKQHCESVAGIWKVKEKYVKRYKLKELKFSEVFSGPPPLFEHSEKKKTGPKAKDLKDLSEEDRLIQQAKKEMKEKRKQQRLEKKKKQQEMEREAQRMREMHERMASMTAEQKAAFKEKMKQEKLAEKEKKKAELRQKWEEEKMKRKEERDKEREKKREEKRIREEFLKEWNKPREDMECDDLKDMPAATPVQTLIPSELFGNAVMVLEYLMCFDSMLGIREEYPDFISLEAFCKALQDTDSKGLFSDILRLLMVAVFNLQEEEEEDLEGEMDVDEADHKFNEDREARGLKSFNTLAREAVLAAQIPQQKYSMSLRELPMDAFTLSEILRLHFLSSGASTSLSNVRYQWAERGGYSNLDDPGLELKRQEPGIIRALEQDNVFDLDPESKLKILEALIHQLLTYVNFRDVIEDNVEKIRGIKHDLRHHQWAEDRRKKEETTFWWKKRQEEKAKEKELEAQKKEQKKKEKEEKIRADESGSKVSERKAEEMEVVKEEAPKPEKRSTRQQEMREREEEAKELPEKNIDWEKITPEEREKMRSKYLRKEKELNKLIMDLQHSIAISPLGRDRTFRRFWVFKSIPGLFVEDFEEEVPDDFLQPITQVKRSEEEKSASSDKENDSFDQGGNANGSAEADKPLGLSNGLNQGPPCLTPQTSAVNKTALEVDQARPPVFMTSLEEQIASRNKFRWMYYHTSDQLQSLIDSLNPRGFREGPLKQVLSEQKAVLSDHLEGCPVNVLSISKKEEDAYRARRAQFQKLKHRHGMAVNNSAHEFMELNMREMLLDLEERIYHGTLGNLQVKDRTAWRDAIEKGNYSTETDEMPWSKAILNAQQARGLEPMETDARSQNDDGDDSDDDEDITSLPVVKDMAQALMQIAHMVDDKYLQAPLGTQVGDPQKKPPKKAPKKAVKKPNKDEDSDDTDDENEKALQKSPRERWEESLQSATNLSQVFLHLSILEKSVVWSKSALHARCKICRRKGDGEKMLLCDGCDRGHHMYCLKPPVKKVPQGDWFCPDCKPKEVMRTPRKRRKSIFDEDDELDEPIMVDSDSTEEEEADSDDEEEEEEEEDEEDDTEADSDEETEEESQDESEAPKIKFLARAKKQPASGRSTPTSVSSRASGSRSRQSLETNSRRSADKRVSAGSRKSLEVPERPSSRNSRRSQEPAKPPSRPSSRAGRASLEPAERTRTSTRKSLEPVGVKRLSQSPDEGAPEAKKASLSKSRGGDKINVQKLCETLIHEMAQKDEAWPFLKPVLRRDAPDYFDIIKSPMDFSTMRNKINHFEYNRPSEILTDARLIFQNCEQYNMPTAPEYQAGKKLSRYFEKRVKELKLEAKVEAVRSPVKGSPSNRRSSSRNK